MRHLRADELEIHRRIDLAQQVVLRHEFLERHHLEFVLRGHGRLQHHAIKKQKPRTWRGFVSNLSRPEGRLFVRRPARRVRRAKSRTQKRWIRPTPTPTWLRDDDGDVLKPSPIDAVASMILPPASVLPFAR
ncbi:putative non-ribosomal peptide synthase [Burkholderia pseudomallei]|nr:putative non-ribosomal peptide synthase [Burkholderia pseudomallei]CAJ7929214.1 putative non-ribosomal peptide synthase [Burkholderia pseudomallei]